MEYLTTVSLSLPVPASGRKAAPTTATLPAPRPTPPPCPPAQVGGDDGVRANHKAVENEILSSMFVASMFTVRDSDDEDDGRLVAPARTPATPRQCIDAVCHGDFPPAGDAAGTHCRTLLSAAYWRQFLPPMLPHAGGAKGDDGGVDPAVVTDIVTEGYASSPSPVPGSALACMLPALSAAVDALRAAGWPPVFVFMLDEAWHLVRHAFHAVQPVLGADCVLEPSVFAWALLHPQAARAAGPTIGAAFTLPHRDYRYRECWTDAGQPALLNVWIPLTAATLFNGCMYVVPREADALFDASDHPDHLKCALPSTTPTAAPAAYVARGGNGGGIKHAPHLGKEVRLKFDIGAARPLPCDAGTVLMWTGNTIHWGSGCSSKAQQPRQSIAMAFRRADFDRSHLEQDMPALRCMDVEPGRLPMATRLRLAVKGLRLFQWWFGDDVPESALPAVFWAGVREASGGDTAC